MLYLSIKAYNIPEKYMKGLLGKKYAAASKKKKVKRDKGNNLLQCHETFFMTMSDNNTDVFIHIFHSLQNKSMKKGRGSIRGTKEKQGEERSKQNPRRRRKKMRKPQEEVRSTTKSRDNVFR